MESFLPGIEWKRIFDVLRDATPEVFLSIVFGLVGYAAIRWLSWIPGVPEWLVMVLVTPTVSGLSAFYYWTSTTPGSIPYSVAMDPSRYILLMTVVVGIVPGFIVCPLMLKLFRKRTATGQTQFWKRGNTQDAAWPGDGT